jgi:hypothetical protein
MSESFARRGERCSTSLGESKNGPHTLHITVSFGFASVRVTAAE